MSSCPSFFGHRAHHDTQYHCDSTGIEWKLAAVAAPSTLTTGLNLVVLRQDFRALFFRLKRILLRSGSSRLLPSGSLLGEQMAFLSFRSPERDMSKPLAD